MKIPNTIGITTLIHLLMSSLLIIKETNGIDLRINYLGAIYTNLKILSDEYTLSISDYELIFKFLRI